MKLNKDIETALSDQVNREFFSSYLYLSMAGFADRQNLPGFMNWLTVQAEEERAHGTRLIRFVSNRGGRVKLQAIAAPPYEFDGMVPLFESVLGHEREVTQNIHDLYALAIDKKDYATQVELQWFINEQVEEEKNATDILEHLKRVKDSPQGLFSLDRQLATRTSAAAGTK